MDDCHDADNLISAEALAAAREAKRGSATLGGEHRRKGRPPKRPTAAAFDRTIGRLANHQDTERGIMAATAATFKLLRRVTIVAEMLTPVQLAQLVFEIFHMANIGLPQSEMEIALVTARIVSTDLGRVTYDADPDDHEET